MFQQTVVSVSQSDQSSDSTRWGETTSRDEKEYDTTASDQEDNEEGGNDTREESQGKIEENDCEEAKANTKDFTEIVKTMNNVPDDHYVWGYLDPIKAYYANENNAEAESNENKARTDFINWYDGQLHNIMENYEERTVETRSNNANPEDWNSPSIEELKPALETRKDKQETGINEPSIKAVTLTQLTHMEGGSKPVDETASPEKEAEGSSSTEPGWGRIESRKERERMEDLRRWESINVGDYASQRTTKAYRHGRCYMCSKPVSTTDLDPSLELFCKECDERLIALDCGYDRPREKNVTKRRLEKAEKDDEEEWGRIPIPQSDDSEDDTWLEGSDDSDQEREIRPACVVSVDIAFDTKPDKQETGKNKVNTRVTDDFAFRHGPRRDGIILRKDGSILTITDLNPHETEQSTNKNMIIQETKMNQKLPDETSHRPQWTSALLTFQRLRLKMAYKSKTKLRARIMKQIRKRVKNATISPSTQLNQLRILSMYQHTQFDTAKAYMNGQGTTYHEGQTLNQCMNSLQSIPPKRKRRNVKMKVRVATQQSQPKREKTSFTPITIPGTPEEDINPQSPQISLPRTNTKERVDEDLAIYYKVFNRHKPEFGEFNAESTARTTALEAEYRYLLMKKKTKENQNKKERERIAKFHSLSPSAPPQATVTFKRAKQSHHHTIKTKSYGTKTRYATTTFKKLHWKQTTVIPNTGKNHSTSAYQPNL
jgi:hypothetical protein